MWQTEERKTNPLKQGDKFDFRLKSASYFQCLSLNAVCSVLDAGFDVLLNGEHFHFFAHRKPLEEIETLQVRIRRSAHWLVDGLLFR